MATAAPSILRDLQDVLANGASEDRLDSLKAEFPDACAHVYGSTNFTAAGPGILSSVIVQTALYLTLGLLVTVASLLLPDHASRASKLTLARLKTIWDQTYKTGSLIHVAALIAAWARVRYQGPAMGAYEYGLVNTELSIYYSLLILAFVSHGLYRSPTGIQRSMIPGWHSGQTWFPIYAFITLIVDRAFSHKNSALEKAVDAFCQTQKQQQQQQHKFPNVGRISDAHILTFVICGYIALAILALLLAILRLTLLKWIWSIVCSRITHALAATAWTLFALFVLGLNYTQLYMLRRDMLLSSTAEEGEDSRPPAWDLAQTLVLVVWTPVLLRLVLLGPVTWDTFRPVRKAVDGKGWLVGFHFVSLMWACWKSIVGDEPYMKKASDDSGEWSISDEKLSTTEKAASSEKAMCVMCMHYETDAQKHAYLSPPEGEW